MAKMTDAETLRKLLSFASSRGVTSRRVSENEFSSLAHDGTLEEAPFSSHSLGIVWKTKCLYYTRGVEWPEVIHELGHLLACRVPPRSSDEFGFFGWEIAMSHHIGGSLDAWIAGNQDYGVSNGIALKALSPFALHTMLAERLAAAKDTGLLDDDGHPLAIR